MEECRYSTQSVGIKNGGHSQLQHYFIKKESRPGMTGHKDLETLIENIRIY